MPLAVRALAAWRFEAVVAFLALLVFSSTASADVRFEFGLNGGYTDNLLSDSSDLADRHVMSVGAVRFYPISSLELLLSGEHAYYDEVPGLSSRLGKVAFHFIPLGRDSRFSVSLSGSFDGRRYRKQFNSYDNNSLNARASVGYRLLPTVSGRLGVSYDASSYLGSDNGDKRNGEVSVGGNFTVLGENSIDLEAGYGVADYKSIDEALVFIDPRFIDAALLNRTLRSLYFSPRYSRPLGSNTGINVTLLARNFLNDDEALVFGSSVGLLSPWTSVWEGWSATVSAKTYLIPGVITSAGAGYWEKTYLDALESSSFPIVAASERDDIQKKVYLQFIRSFSCLRGGTIQPSVQVDYAHNNSTNKLFNYSGFSFSAGFLLRL